MGPRQYRVSRKYKIERCRLVVAPVTVSVILALRRTCCYQAFDQRSPYRLLERTFSSEPGVFQVLMCSRDAVSFDHIESNGAPATSPL